MGIKHLYTQTVADGTATSVVRPSDWNSVHAYTLQDAVSLAGNTSGVLANISSGTLVLAGGNNITLSQNGNSVSVSGPELTAYLTTAALSQDSSKYAGTNGAITGGSITVNTSGVSVNLPNYLTTARASADAIGLNTAQSNVTWTVNSSGISLDARGYAGSGFSSGGNNIGLSATQNSAGLSLSATVAAQTVQSQNVHNVTLGGNTAGVMAQVSSGTLTLAGGNNITVSQNGNAITISGANAGGAQTGISGLIVSDATYTSGTVSFSNAGNITIGSSVNGATQFIRLSGNPAQTTQSAIKAFGVSNTGQTAGNTGVSTGIDWVLAGSGSVTLSQSTAAGGPNTVWFQHPAWLTTAALSQDSSNYAGTNGAITGGSITVNTSGISVNLPAYLTTADLSANSSKYVQAWEITGNTAGTTSSAAGTKLYFSGGNSLTVSGSGNTIVLSVGNYLTTAALSQDSSKYAGTGFTSGGANVGLSGTLNTAGFSLSATVAAQSVQTQNVVDVSLSGNTAGVLALISSGTAIFAGGNNITLSQNGQSITISGANVGGAQTGISGIVVSDTTYTSGTVSFSNQANITIGSSVNGATQYIRLSGNAAQTTQSAIKAFGVSNTGQTAGNTGVSTGIDWVLAGSNSITLSQSTAGGGPNTIWFQHPAWLTTAGLSQDSSKYAGTGFTSAGANVGISGTQNTAGLSLSVTAAAQTNQTVGLYASSNTYLTSSGTIDARSLSFRGDKSITVGISSGEVLFSVGAYITTAMLSNRGSDFVQATAGFNGTNASGTIASNSISVSVAAPIPIATAVKAVGSLGSTGTITRYAPEDHQHAGVAAIGISTSGNTAGTTGSQVGTYWIQGGNSITVSQITSNNGSHTLVISAGNYLTTAMASNRGSDFVQATAAFAGTNANGTIASDGISVSVAAPIPIGTAVKAVGSAGSTGTITRYAPEDHAHAGVAAIGISTSGNTAGTTGSQVGTYWIQGGNSITVSQITSNNGSHTLVISAGNYLTTAALSQDSSKYAGTGFTSAGANVGISGTQNTAGLSLSVTAAAQTNQTIGGYAVGNTTGQSSSSTFDARTVSFNGAGNVSVGYSAGSIVISGGAVASVNFSAGTTSGNIASIVFGNSNGLSFGLSASTITANANTVGTATTVKAVASANSVGTVTRWAGEDHAHAGIGALGISTGNTAGTSGSVQGSYWFAGSNLASVSQITSNNGSHTLVVNASLPAASLYAPEWAAFSGKATNSSLGHSTVYFQPFDLPYYLSASRINFYVSLSGSMSAGNSTGTCSAGIGYGIYTLATGADSRTLSLLTSYSLQLYSISFTSNTVFAATHYAGLSNATSHTTVQTIISNANATTYQATNLNGPRVVAMPLGITMTPGRYYLGVSVQTVSGNALTNNLSVMQTSVGVQPAVYPIGSASSASNASVFGPVQGWGFYSAQTGAFPATIPFTTDAIRRAVAAQTLVPFEIVGYATSTNII